MPAEKNELKAIFDNLPIGVAYLDAQFRFIRINKFFTELTEMKSKELLGKHCYETIGEYVDDPMRKGLEKVCSFCVKEGCFVSRRPCVIERPLRDKLVRVKLIPQLDEQGATHHLLGLFEDITESRQAEKSLKESENKYRMLSQEYHTLLDAIHNVILLLSPELKVIWANKYAVNVMAVHPAEMGRRYCFDLVKHDNVPCRDCHALECFRIGEPVSANISAPDGKILESEAFPVRGEHGRVNRVIMIYRDITEEIKLRAETMRAGHLASIGELAAGVAHEINNPINGIINYAQMIADKAPKAGREYDLAGEIIEECRRITKIVRSLLSFAKSGQEEKTSISIHDVLSNTLSLCQKMLEKNDVILKTYLPQSPPAVIGNSNQIQQIFLNLITNSLYALNRKYPRADHNKRLEITGKKISRDGQPFFRITFHDQGTGIPSSILDKVVHPFFSTKPSGLGTGLGLSISYGIISDHNGKMHIESREGEFTAVTIDLPAESKISRSAGDRYPGAGMKELSSSKKGPS